MPLEWPLFCDGPRAVPAAFNDANGRVVVTYDDEADLTVAAVALP